MVSDIVCPFCGNVQQLDPRWLVAASHYADMLERQLGGLQRYKEEAVVAKGAWGPLALMGVGVGVAILLASLMAILYVDHPVFNALIFVAPLLLCVIPAAFAMLAQHLQDQARRASFRAHATPEQLAIAKVVSCPSCGAQQEIAPGATVGACQYCRASLIATLAQMNRGGWENAITVRRRVAGIRAPSPWWRKERDFDALSRHALQQPVKNAWARPWDGAEHLAALIGGQNALHHRDRWMYGYWPEQVSSFMPQSSFVWGYCHGYPVAVHASAGTRTRAAVIKIYVAALTLPSPHPWKAWGLDAYRTLAGYHCRGWLSGNSATAEGVAGILREVCALAQREGFPPAPFLEPLK